MAGDVDVLHPEQPKRIALLASNPAVSEQTGCPIGFWRAELTHPYWELNEHGYELEICSPAGGKLEGDSWSDPRDASGYSAQDLIGLGFINSPEHMGRIEQSTPLAEIRVDDYDAVFLVGGQGPMCTFFNDERVHSPIGSFSEAGKPTVVVCHVTCTLLRTRLANGELLVGGKTWSGFANSEERFADEYVGQKIQPSWIEEEAAKLPNTKVIVNGRFKPHAVGDGNLITGQQQYSGVAAARLLRGARHVSTPQERGSRSYTVALGPVEAKPGRSGNRSTGSPGGHAGLQYVLEVRSDDGGRAHSLGPPSARAHGFEACRSTGPPPRRGSALHAL